MVVSCSCRCSVFKVLVALYMLWSLILISEAEPLYNICRNTTTYDPNSTYQVNLNRLLSTLSSPNITRNNLFYNATAGNSAPDRAYGLFMCRGDVTSDSCHDCVVNATREIVERCPKEKEAYIWYDECMLRYANESFFSTMDEMPRVSMYNMANVSEPDRLEQVLNKTMNNLATRASNDQSDNSGQLKGFATGEANLTSNATLYSLVQCTPDLSGADCNRCFRVAIGQLPGCCSGKQGGRVLLPSCNIRYEIYPFYAANVTASPPSPKPTLPPTAPAPQPTTATPTLPPTAPAPQPTTATPTLSPPAPQTTTPTPTLPPPAPSSSTSPEGNGRISAQVIYAVVFAVVASIFLFTNEVSITELYQDRRRRLIQ